MYDSLHIPKMECMLQQQRLKKSFKPTDKRKAEKIVYTYFYSLYEYVNSIVRYIRFPNNEKDFSAKQMY